MPPRHVPRRPDRNRSSLPAREDHWLVQRPLAEDGVRIPVARLKSVRRHPHVYRKQVDQVASHARPGDVVDVHSPDGVSLGYGLYNPRAEIVVRMLGKQIPTPDYWRKQLENAVSLRTDLLRLPHTTDAFRLIHAEADGLPGLVVDRYADVLSAETFSLAMYQRAEALLTQLAGITGAKHWIYRAPAQTHGQEAFKVETAARSDACPDGVTVRESGTKFRLDFGTGHKTGFFCDQRDNRARLAALAKGRSVLDLCCYTGGFAITASHRGHAAHVTGVDLDEDAIAAARANAKLNACQMDFVHADAFGYARDMLQNGRQFDLVVLDPPKFIRTRREEEEGRRKYLDLNRLAMQLVAPGGVYVTCTCSGLLANDEFVQIVRLAAEQSNRNRETAGHPAPQFWQIFDRTGAAADHPVGTQCPEGEYLHAVWLRAGR